MMKIAKKSKITEITTESVKRIYWDHAEGKLFSSETDWDATNKLPEDNLDIINHPFEIIAHKIPLLVDSVNQQIRFDGAVYEALNYGFREESIFVDAQMTNFLEALESTFVGWLFEPYDNSIIDFSEK